MREHAEDLYSTGDQVAGDPFAAETLGRHLARRIAELADNPDTPLFFGKHREPRPRTLTHCRSAGSQATLSCSSPKSAISLRVPPSAAM